MIDHFSDAQGDNARGLKLFKGEAITVGRIVNDEWYQGYKDENTCGYFPRAFVHIKKYAPGGSVTFSNVY